MRILAVDPGKMSGYAWYRTEDPTTFEAGQKPMLDCLDHAYSLVKRQMVDVVVCEDYIITQRTIKLSRQNMSLESIGVLRWLCSAWMIRFVLQTPSEGKGFGTDEKLKRLGWYRPTPGGHANDATRHLLTFLAKERQLPAGLL